MCRVVKSPFFLLVGFMESSQEAEMMQRPCLLIIKMFKELSLLEKVQHLLVTTHYHSRELQ